MIHVGFFVGFFCVSPLVGHPKLLTTQVRWVFFLQAESEQGRIQGALYSVQALASGVGPILLRAVNSRTKEMPYPGPGIMFVFAGFLYLIATSIAFALPKDKANSRGIDNSSPLREEYDEIEHEAGEDSLATSLL
jgi:sugar phosphate permease